MKKLVALLLLIGLFIAVKPAVAAPVSCDGQTVGGGTVFTLAIERSFFPRVEFRLCNLKNPDKQFLLVLVEYAWNSKPMKVRRVPLDPAAYKHMTATYEDALGVNLKDKAIGMDGSNWCLETDRGMNHLQACFWTPMDKAQQRGLSGLVALGQELWRLAGMDDKVVGPLS